MLTVVARSRTLGFVNMRVPVVIVFIIAAQAPRVVIAQPAQDAEKAAASAKASAEQAAISAADAKAAKDQVDKSAAVARNSAEEAKAYLEAARGVVGKPEPATVEDRTKAKTPVANPFATVQLLGDANITSGTLAGTDKKTVGSGAAGVLAATKHFSLLAAFTFGSQQSASGNATKTDYISFLRTPNSAVGGQTQLRYLFDMYQWWNLGPALNLRVNGTSLTAAGVTQELNFLQIDMSAATSVQLDKDRTDLFFVAEAGLAMRFWNKPSDQFVTAVNIVDSHAVAGPRVLAALTIGHIHIGVEVTRFFGGDLNDYNQFTVIPYVGLEGGLDVVKPAASTSAGAPGFSGVKGVVVQPALTPSSLR